MLSLQYHKASNSNAGPHLSSGLRFIQTICGVSSALLALLHSPVHVDGAHNMNCHKFEHVNLFTTLTTVARLGLSLLADLFQNHVERIHLARLHLSVRLMV